MAGNAATYWKDYIRAMGRERFIAVLRHPAFAVFGAILFAIAAFAFIRGGMEARARLAVDDPVQISDQALDRLFNRDVAEREIRVALATGDNDLAQSFVELAADRSVAIDPALADEVKQAQVKARSVAGTTGRFVQGLWTGEPVDGASLAGTAVGDLFVFGDIRDAAREGTRYLTGKPADPWILGLAGVGIAITAATYVSVGVATPARIGLTLVKAARRTGRLNPVLAVRIAREAVKVEQAGGIVELVGNVGRVETKAGTQAALDSLKIAEKSAARVAIGAPRRRKRHQNPRRHKTARPRRHRAHGERARSGDVAVLGGLHAARLCLVEQSRGRAHDAALHSLAQGAPDA